MLLGGGGAGGGGGSGGDFTFASLKKMLILSHERIITKLYYSIQWEEWFVAVVAKKLPRPEKDKETQE